MCSEITKFEKFQFYRNKLFQMIFFPLRIKLSINTINTKIFLLLYRFFSKHTFYLKRLSVTRMNCIVTQILFSCLNQKSLFSKRILFFKNKSSGFRDQNFCGQNIAYQFLFKDILFSLYYFLKLNFLIYSFQRKNSIV